MDRHRIDIGRDDVLVERRDELRSVVRVEIAIIEDIGLSVVVGSVRLTDLVDGRIGERVAVSITVG